MSTILPGQNNGAGAIDVNLLKVFGEETFASFDASTEMGGMHTIKRSQKARSVTFPVLGKLTASYHTPGDEMYGQETKQTERVITVDRVLVSPIEVYDLDEIFSHYDTRRHYTEQAGRSIALEYDRHILQTAILAGLDVSEDKDFVNKAFEAADPDAPTAAECNVNAGANNDAYTADEIFAWVKAVALKFDERFVPAGQRYMGLRPVDYQTLVTAFNAAGAGFYLSPKTPEGSAVTNAPEEIRLQGITIRKLHSLDLISSSTYFTTNTETRKGKRYAATGAGEATVTPSTDPYYNALFPKVKGVAWTPNAVGTLLYKNLEVETYRDSRRMTNFVNSMMAASHGVLSPDESIVIYDQT